MNNKVFADGLFTKVVTTKFGEIIKIGVKVEDFKQFLDTYESNWFVNLNLMTSKEWNKKYFELDEWKKEETKKEEEMIDVEDIPF